MGEKPECQASCQLANRPGRASRPTRLPAERSVVVPLEVVVNDGRVRVPIGRNSGPI